MTERKALFRRQFRQSGFDEADYAFNTQPGTFTATIDCKRWGKGKKLVTYMTFTDGRKIVAPTWPGRSACGRWYWLLSRSASDK